MIFTASMANYSFSGARDSQPTCMYVLLPLFSGHIISSGSTNVCNTYTDDLLSSFDKELCLQVVILFALQMSKLSEQIYIDLLCFPCWNTERFEVATA